MTRQTQKLLTEIRKKYYIVSIGRFDSEPPKRNLGYTIEVENTSWDICEDNCWWYATAKNGYFWEHVVFNRKPDHAALEAACLYTMIKDALYYETLPETIRLSNGVTISWTTLVERYPKYNDIIGSEIWDIVKKVHAALRK